MSLTISLRALVLISVVASVGAAGCNLSPGDQRARDEKTRDEVAKATERAKPVIKEAGRKVGEAAQEAAHEARAAAEGLRDGLKDGRPSLVDVNSATEGQLLDLPGISKPEARKIIDNRPYADKHDLVAKGAVSGATYDKIRDRVIAK
jgi:DNA uptake protein ComE-like DNA-binding protein